MLAAREQPVGRFLEELLGQVGVPAQVDDTVRGTVNGDFNGPASIIFNDIANSFQLMMYFDGAVAWIYPSKEVVRELMPATAKASKAVMRSANTLGMTDARNRISHSDVGLVVTGTERFVEQVNELVQAVGQSAEAPAKPKPVVQQQSADAVMRVFKLRYAWAADVSIDVGGQQVQLPGVATTLRQLIEPGAIRGVMAPTPSGQDGSLQGLRGQGLQSTALNSAAADAQRVLNNDNGSTSSTRIVADALGNSVIVRDRADRMDEYADLISALDVEPEMIEIEATIIDLNTDRLRELGVNWRAQDQNGNSVLFGQGNATDLELFPDSNIASSAQGGVVSLVLGDSVQFLSRIRALETEGAARVVSKPHVMTLSNVEALLNTTSTFFVRVEGDEEVDLFDVSVGTTLRVTPHVFEADSGARIRLRVNIEDGSTTDQTVDSIPIVERSNINTQALIHEGESLLIGGLVREFDVNGVSKVPVLGSIPFVGALFRNNTQASSRVERMFLITPRVNLRSRQGLRYNAPITSGLESDIIRSAPARMDRALAGIAARDDAWPLRQDIPRSSGNANLVPRSQVRPEDLPPLPRPAAPAARASGPSIHERLGLPAPNGSRGGRQAITQPNTQPIAPAPRQWDEWQEVRVNEAPQPVVPVATRITAAPSTSTAASSSRAATQPIGGTPNFDEWQEVTQ